MSLPKFSVGNSVLVNLVMILIIAMGTYALFTLPRELMPQIRLNRVVVAVPFPGASPEEVEKLITKPIEDEIESLDHLDMFVTVSKEGQARLNVIFESISEDEFRRVYQDLRQAVDRVNLPDGAEDPFYLSLESSTWMPMATVAISGELPESRMKELAEELQDDIERLRGVDSVSVSGLREREVWVQIDPHKLYKHNLTLQQVGLSLLRQNVGLAGGNIEVGPYEYLLRSVEEFESLEDIADVVIKEDRVGNHVRVRDVATLIDTYEEPTTISRFNGKPSVSLDVYKKPEGNTLDLTEQFRALLQEKQRAAPAGVVFGITNDFSPRILSGIDRLLSNGFYGGFFVLLILFLILGWRNALFVLWGIPITFLLTFVFIDLYGESINESSLFALVLVLGMIVDDAIVVIENISRYLNRGYGPKEAAIKGTEEVIWPVFTSSLTTIAAFLPLMLLPGVIGEFMKVIPVCLSFALAASLFESLVTLPSHVSDLGASDVARHHGRVNRTIRKVAARYRRIMGFIIRRRWAFIPLFLILLSSTLLVIPYVGVDLYADDAFPFFLVRIWMPEGTSIDETDAVTRGIEEVALTLPEADVKAVVSQVGRLDTESDRISAKDVSMIRVDVRAAGVRTRSIDEIMGELEKGTKHVTGYREIQFAKLNTGPPVGKPVEIKIKGRHFEVLEEIAQRFKNYLATIPGVHTIQDDLQRGKNEIRIHVDENRAHLVSLDESDIAQQVKYAFEGVPATVYRDGDEEIDVVVKFQENFRDSIQDINDLKIPTRGGGLVPFHTVASFTIERGWAKINRFDGERAVTVSAETTEGVASPVEVTALAKDFYAGVEKEYPGYRLDFRGEFQEFEEAFTNVGQLFLVGVILIYLILGGQFRSYLQPLLVMFAIPFAFAGAMLYLITHGYPFTIMAMYGMVALSGVAVNDSIVLIAFVNDARKRGASPYRAVLNGAKRRLRPIFLTTVTTILGLLPMALGIGGKSVVWMPMAGTIVWGVGVATFLILLVMPPLYLAAEDLHSLVFRRRKKVPVVTGAPQAADIRIREVS
jgi:multidrug efflux pump subunit AcrB